MAFRPDSINATPDLNYDLSLFVIAGMKLQRGDFFHVSGRRLLR